MSTFSISTKHLSQVRTIVELSATPADQAATPWGLLESLQSLIGSEAAVLIGVDPLARVQYHAQAVASGERQQFDSEEMVSYGPDHPYWQHYPGCRPCSHPDRVGGRAVVAVGDFYSPAEWLAHPMRREVLSDVFDEVVLAVHDGGGHRAAPLPRGPGRAFGERERFALWLLLPHLEPFIRAAVVPSRPDDGPLTSRQWDILEGVRLGLTNKQIARRLGVSTHTVRKHLENIFERLGVHTRGRRCAPRSSPILGNPARWAPLTAPSGRSPPTTRR